MHKADHKHALVTGEEYQADKQPQAAVEEHSDEYHSEKKRKISAEELAPIEHVYESDGHLEASTFDSPPPYPSEELERKAKGNSKMHCLYPLHTQTYRQSTTCFRRAPPLPEVTLTKN